MASSSYKLQLTSYNLQVKSYNLQVNDKQRSGGLVKPDIVFFGEQLPERFGRLVPADFDACDLLLVMGTSLQVQPFASLVDMPARDRRCGSQISVLQNETTRPRLYPAVLQLLSLESPRIHAMLGKRGAVP